MVHRVEIYGDVFRAASGGSDSERGDFSGGSESKCFRVLSSVIRIGSRFISPRGNDHKNGYGDSEEKLFRGIRTGAEKSGFKGAGCGLRVFGDGGREKTG